MKTTLKDLIHAINILGDDVDVYVDGIDSIAVCPPVKITNAGREYFKEALNATVISEYVEDCHNGFYVSNDDESIDKKAWDLLVSLAGYCDGADFDMWFEGDETKII